jgi:hypothetical protein
VTENAKEFFDKESEIYQSNQLKRVKEHHLNFVYNMISIRPAVENDIEAICSVDLIAQRENERREFIRRAVTSGKWLKKLPSLRQRAAKFITEKANIIEQAKNFAIRLRF